MPMPDLESLACVDALARTLRFSAAAESRHLSPAAFSKRIRQAEEHLGQKLFSRTTRRVELTAAGAALLPRLRRLLHEAGELSGSHTGTAPVELVLGTRHELGMSWLMPARRALAAALPHVTVHLRFGGTDELERAVLGLRADAVVTSRAPSTTKLEAVPLAREDYVFVAAPRLLKTRPLRQVADAQAHTLLDAHDDLPLYSYLRAAGVSLRFARVVTLGTIDSIRWAALDGEGVAVLPRYFVAEAVRRRRLAVVLPRVRPAHDFFRLVFRADDPQRPLLEEVAGILRSRPLM